MLFRLALAVIGVAIGAASAPIGSLYFFGDSLTDTGNVYKATSVLNRYTFGLVPLHPTEPYSAGRFTDGAVWAEHVTARLGRDNDAAPAGMSLGLLGRVGGSGGNNYAVGGARTDSGGVLGLLDIAIPTGIFEQVDFHLSSMGGGADPEGLYFLWGGGNDIRDAARIADPGQRAQAAVQAGINLAYSVQRLYFAGARNFVLINSPDVGLIPETIGDGLMAAGTDASVQFNTWFGLYANYLYSVPAFSLHYFDVFSLHRELVMQYGLDAVRPCKSDPGSCSSALFFDSVHPTAWVHEVIGNRVADQVLGPSMFSPAAAAAAETPEPSTGVLAAVGTGILFFVRGRRRTRRV
jgi:outer membrane lipase/esterase